MNRISVEDELPEYERSVKIYAKKQVFKSLDGDAMLFDISVIRKAIFREDEIWYLVDIDSNGEILEVTHWEYLNDLD